MSSSSRCCATGVFVLPSLLLLPLFLSLVFGVQGATLREHRLSGTEPVSYGPASQIRPPPSAEMLRALRYIQSLSQRTPSDPLSDERQPDQEEDDMESIRSMLQLAAPGRMDRGMEEREEERDNTQELLQAVLKTLQQTEEHMVPQKVTATQPRYAIPQKMPQKVIATQPRYAIHPFPRPKQQLEVETSSENYGRTSWADPDSRRRHRQYPLMFEDEEDQEQPLKRTNENAEEQYTPQKLATLQSVFEELSGISTTKAKSKRDDVEEDDEDEDNDLYGQRKMVLEDIMGTDEWAPLEEQIETEEEERERHGFDRDLEDDDQEEEEEEEEDDVKRSNQSNWFQTGKEEEPEDIAKLMDYYLLQVLKKKEQEQQKRQEASKSEQESDREVEKKDVDEDEDDEDEEEYEEEREIKPMHNTFPESLSQIIKISQKLRIPPEEVLELLQNERRKNLLGIPAQSHTPYATAHKAFAAAPHRRPSETSEGNRVAQDILSILELVNAVQQNDKRPTQPNTSRYYERETSKDDYDNTAGEEDELANYLASEMLSQGQRRPTPMRDEDQRVYGNLERAVQDYLDKSTPEKRTAEHEDTAMGLDNNTMLQILRYLEPESDNTDETDSEGKTVPEM
ncbi:secretogranin-2 [Ctenopharyngodon idella]|uniref:secretogranin-2 n=1 Tax=Ctenopharyngodon idella TaxID=7959 RepID=UPI0022302CAA|nr:secretogranin-2 [Ctenopharyngodon idella]